MLLSARFSATSAILFLQQTVSAALYNQVVSTEYGPVQGFQYFNNSANLSNPSGNVAAFLGVPYAADTSYENRWREAQPREPWNDTLHAIAFGPACPIASQAQAGFTLSEDCLSVNIWTNAKSSADRLPVFLWSYGSGETSGEALYDGGGLATQDVVVVTYNYRDAAFGFLAHPDLSAESGRNTSGNYGIMDMFTALRWIKSNIANFGGDPDHIVIGGQSFGSAQVYHAVNSPLAKGLFKGMIAESGIRDPYDYMLAGLADSYSTLDVALKRGVNYTKNHNVSSIAELRALSMESLLSGSDDRDYSLSNVTALWTMNPPLYKTVLDGYVVPSTYLKTLETGPASDVPMITGNNRDESGASTGTSYTLSQYYLYNSLKYGNLSSRYFSLYPAHNSSQGNRAWNAAARDTSLVSSWLFSQKWYKKATSPFYTYYWDYAPPGQSQGAYHMAEINYVLNNLYKTDRPWTAYDYWLADVMSSYWANFIKTLDPNTGGSYRNGSLPTWAPTDARQEVMHTGTQFGNVPIAQPAQVDLISDWFATQPPY
ncbi:alpha/beta-hydrolase [Pseudovirgaria hyperparasitica]|uniref:Alpha/beta-hydrolase n=1 Tax=Pseudovirgaria hyperparasitica TaxID=470096 RepID=A0A6A6VZ15_9PEZI|nr:alpha/beta-hydrolase [Pseudovirgaria hyperparasitica]KAF2755918.1 alpha/beta-hydrolase [Pseudovirgaria hyperparasitica]